MSGDDPSPWSRAAADAADTATAPSAAAGDHDRAAGRAGADAARPGELSPGWRLVTAVTWIAVAVAIGSIWKTSAQLGLSTWWLGPRGDPRPRVVQLMPFAPSIVMILGTINNARRLPQLGLAASAIIAAIGIVDLGRVVRLGAIEIGIGIAAAAVSIASTTGCSARCPRCPGPAAPKPTPGRFGAHVEGLDVVARG
jgi:hypothetical protein